MTQPTSCSLSKYTPYLCAGGLYGLSVGVRRYELIPRAQRVQDSMLPISWEAFQSVYLDNAWISTLATHLICGAESGEFGKDLGGAFLVFTSLCPVIWMTRAAVAQYFK